MSNNGVDAVLYDGTVCGSYGPFITLYPG